jgi:hypothetical protein
MEQQQHLEVLISRKLVFTVMQFKQNFGTDSCGYYAKVLAGHNKPLDWKTFTVKTF